MSKSPFVAGIWRVLLAGLLAGIVSSIIQPFLTLPLIALGEQLGESLAGAPDMLAFDRFSGTIIANLATAVSLALLLFAILFIFNLRINYKNAFPWVICFWLTLFFIPAIVLPPTLPGTDSGGEVTLRLRQMVWLGLAFAAAIGFLLQTEFFKQSLGQKTRMILSTLLLVVPVTVVMAIWPIELTRTSVPAEAVQLFVMYSLLSGLLLSTIIVMVFAIGDRT